MTVKKVGNQWAVVKKNGKIGKGRFKSRATAEKAQARGRRLAKANPIGKSGNPSRGSSGGGSTAAGKTSIIKRIGRRFREIRLAMGLTAPAWGRLPHGDPDIPVGDRVSQVIDRYSGYDIDRGDFNIERAYPAWEGMATAGINDWVDRKTGTAGKITQGKAVHVLKELIPMLRARAEVPAGAAHPLYEGATNYNKRVTGYDPNGGTWDINRLEEYGLGKALAIAYDELIPDDLKQAANRALPKGWNPF